MHEARVVSAAYEGRPNDLELIKRWGHESATNHNWRVQQIVIAEMSPG